MRSETLASEDVKKLVQVQEDLKRVKNTPQFNGLFPAQLLFGHRLETLQWLKPKFQMKGYNSTWNGGEKNKQRLKNKWIDLDVLSHFNFVLEAISRFETTNQQG